MMLSALSAADYVTRFLPVNALTPQYNGFTEKDATSVCTAVWIVSTTTVESLAGGYVSCVKRRKNDKH